MNCFHLSVSLRYNTTDADVAPAGEPLWIAFIYPYLWDTTQLSAMLSEYRTSCELLSFIRIFEIQHNLGCVIPYSVMVVNCFHLSVSLRYNTTLPKPLRWTLPLWIAFIYPYLWDTTQPYTNYNVFQHRCELLSFIRIFEIQHNDLDVWNVVEKVVNCFHLSVSLRYNTTTGERWHPQSVLWIAFIYPYLWDTTQL